MNIFERIRQKFSSFDINTFSAGTVATIGSMLADNGINIIYALVAVYAHWHTVRNSKAKMAIETKSSEIDMKLKEEDLNLKRLQLKQQADLHDIEVNRLKNGK